METLTALIRSLPGRPELHLTLLVFVRLLPIVVFTPIFGGEALPRRHRVGVSLVLALVFVPSLLSSFTPAETPLVAGLAKEALVGTGIAVLVTMVFELLGAVGALVDVSRGATIANVLNPLTRQQTSVLSVFTVQLLLVLFFSSGAHRIFLRALGESFLVSPIGTVLAPGHATRGLANMLEILSRLFGAAVALAAPPIIVLLLLDVSLALVNRMAQQLEVFFLSLTLKASLGLGVFFLTLGVTYELALEGAVRELVGWMGRL